MGGVQDAMTEQPAAQSDKQPPAPPDHRNHGSWYHGRCVQHADDSAPGLTPVPAPGCNLPVTTQASFLPYQSPDHCNNRSWYHGRRVQHVTPGDDPNFCS
jgi:hypothetical protein